MNTKLLTGIKELKSPDYKNLTSRDRLLRACLLAYVKHSSLNCADEIGWNELTDVLYSAIVNEIGDKEFVAWCDLMDKELVS